MKGFEVNVHKYNLLYSKNFGFRVRKVQCVEFKAIIPSLLVAIMEVLFKFMALKLADPLGSIQFQIHLYDTFLWISSHIALRL